MNHFWSQIPVTCSILIARHVELFHDPTPETGLLFDLSNRSLFDRLSFVEFSFWKGPVVVPGPMNQQNTRFSFAAGAKDQSACRDDLLRFVL